MHTGTLPSCAIEAHCGFLTHWINTKHIPSLFTKCRKFHSVRRREAFWWVISPYVALKGVYLCWFKRYLVFELVWVLVLLLVQINEVVCDALLAACLHVPADLEGVTGDVADLDILRNRKLLHLGDAAILGFTACGVEKQ